jgi:hypothetical protein
VPLTKCKGVTVGEKLAVVDAVLRRILNHTTPKTDVLHRHYVGLSEADVAVGLMQIQEALVELMCTAHLGRCESQLRRLFKVVYTKRHIDGRCATNSPVSGA